VPELSTAEASGEDRRHAVLAVVVAAGEFGGEHPEDFGGIVDAERVLELVSVDAQVGVEARVVVRPVAVRVEVLDRVEGLAQLLPGALGVVLLDGGDHRFLESQDAPLARDEVLAVEVQRRVELIVVHVDVAVDDRLVRRSHRGARRLDPEELAVQRLERIRGDALVAVALEGAQGADVGGKERVRPTGTGCERNDGDQARGTHEPVSPPSGRRRIPHCDRSATAVPVGASTK
jgi:hypothetical protein